MQAKEEHSKLEQQSAIDRKNLEIAELNKRHEVELENKQREIDFYREFKAKLSTKMVGESLEQYCLNEFNKIRMIGFQNATFEKDNDARTGSKGDFIFRESRDGVEFISIMFEMKNEQDETATKKKNEDFLKELDKDRREKKCEYAVLVSMLEADNDFYNAGIVDMSHRYEKMYVVRPQCFIPLITLLRNAALSSLSYRKELVLAQQQSIDLANFESKMNTFKSDFNRNCKLAHDNYEKAIRKIDDTIKGLEMVKEFLQKSDHNLEIADGKAQGLSIKKLTRNSPSIAAMLEAQKGESEKSAEYEDLSPIEPE